MGEIVEGWPPRRAFHRQMYIDLVRAYLPRYGSQDELARALGVSGAFLSVILEPVRPDHRTRRQSYWADAVNRPAHEVAEALRALKTPSSARASQLADTLCSEAEQRDVLLHHIDQARCALRPARSANRAGTLPPDQASEAVHALLAIHDTALHTADPGEARNAYAQVWDAARAAVGFIDDRRQPLDFAQVLMVAHDAACVLDRADLALGYARHAILVLASHPADRDGDRHVRLHTNAALAEVLALNNLGLSKEAMAVAERAQALPGYLVEPEHWLRSFLEQRLRSIRRSGRGLIYDAERAAERARECVPSDVVLVAGIDSHLADVYLADRSPRSRRWAGKLVDRLLPVALGEADVSPLRRVRLLRTAARHFGDAGDRRLHDDLLRRCLTIINAAGLAHQRSELEGPLESV